MIQRLYKAGIWLTTFAIVFTPTLALALVPNDPFAQQWAYEKIGLYKAWDVATGSDTVVVAVIDNGFDQYHPDLEENVWRNEDEFPNNGIDDDANGYIDDVWGWDFVVKDRNGDGNITLKEKIGDNNPVPEPNEVDLTDRLTIHHGTVVAGIIGAVGANEIDGAGVNWNIELMNIRFIDNNGFGSFARLGEAIRYAVDNGAHIINLSLVGPLWNDELASAVSYAYENNVVLVAAAGNDQLDLDETALYPVCADAELEKESIIGVSAITRTRHLAAFSNVGGTCVDIAAPGVDLSSIQLLAPEDEYDDSFGDEWNGTSFAAPLVTGVAALIKSIQPTWGPNEIFAALTESTSVTPGTDPDVYQALFGAGLLQADKAVAYALSQAGAVDVSYLDLISDLFVVFDNGTVGPPTENEAVFTLRNQLRGIDDIASYQDGNNQRFVATRYDEATKKTSVTFYDANWTVVRTWDIDAGGPVDIVIGDVTGSESEEVMLTPTTESSVEAYVYNKFGRLVKEITGTKHTGATVALGTQQENGKYPLYVLTTDNQNGYRIHRYDSTLAEISAFDVEFPASKTPSLAVGRFDGMDVDRIAIGAPPGSLPYIGIFEVNGDFVTTYFSDTFAMTSGIDVAIRSGLLVSVPESVGRELGIWGQDGIRKGYPIRLPTSLTDGATRQFVVAK